MYARTRIALVQSVLLAAALAALLAVITFSVTSLIRAKDDALYGERLNAVMARIDSEQATLAKGGLDGIEAYVQGAQQNLVADLARTRSDAGYLLVLDRDGRVLLHPSLAAGATDLAGSPGVKRIQAEAQSGTLEVELRGEPVWMAHARFAPWGWDVAYVVPLAAKNAPIRALLFRLLGLAAVALAVGVGITWLGSLRVGATVKKVLAETGRLRAAVDAGDLSARGDAAAIEAEFRPIVEGFNSTMDAYERPIRMTAAYVEQISKGHVPAPITDAYRGDFDLIKTSLNRCIESVSRLIQDANGLVEGAVAGKLGTRADPGRHEGEFRKIVDGVNHTLDAVLAPVQEAARVLERLAQRDLRARVEGSYHGEHARIADALNATAAALHTALSQVADAVTQVSSASGQIASSSQAVAAGASEQASSLEETTASLVAMASQTKQAAGNALQANGLAQRAQAAAADGGVAIERMTGAMRKIKASAEGTSEIIKDINEIAFQTNLLALNAAVEAARAGEAGRGFAVVAEEVRSLALRSKEAANKTEDLIRDSVKQAGEGEVTARRVAEVLTEIAGSVGKVTEIVAEITASAKEQAAGIDQINRAMVQMNGVTQQSAASSEESSSAAAELSGRAEELAAMVASFELDRDVQPAAPECRAAARAASRGTRRQVVGARA